MGFDLGKTLKKGLEAMSPSTGAFALAVDAFGNKKSGGRSSSKGGWGSSMPKQSAQFYNTAPTELTGAYQKRYDLAKQNLQPQFNKLRGQASSALDLRGLGRTSAFQNTMADITGQEEQALTSLYGSLISQAQEESMRRDFESMAQSRFNASTGEQQRQFDDTMKWKDYQMSEESNERRRMMAAQEKQKTWELVGQLVGQGASAASSAAMLFSDERIKENIEEIKSPLELILSINPKKYNYKGEGRKTFGVIAQDLEKILPGLVVDTNQSRAGESKLKAVDVYGLVSLVIAGLKEFIEKGAQKDGI